MKTSYPIVFLSLGSNQGDRLDMLHRASEIIALEAGRIIRRSGIYETTPWGMETSDLFLNQVISITTSLGPHDLLKSLQQIESTLGRARIHSSTYLSRPIDIDILFYDDLVIRTKNLCIPHPLIAERRFILVPLAEIARELVHPVLRIPVNELLASCRDPGQVKPWNFVSL